MLFVIFGFLLAWTCIKLFIFGARAAWGITKLMLTIIFFPLILVGMVLAGLLGLAFPIVVVVLLLLMARSAA